MNKVIPIFFFFFHAAVMAQDTPAPSYNSYGLKVFFDNSFNDENLNSEVVNYI